METWVEIGNKWINFDCVDYVEVSWHAEFLPGGESRGLGVEWLHIYFNGTKQLRLDGKEAEQFVQYLERKRHPIKAYTDMLPSWHPESTAPLHLGVSK